MFPKLLEFFKLKDVFRKFLNRISGGEICVANFTPPANGASQGYYFLAKIPKMAVFEAKTG